MLPTGVKNFRDSLSSSGSDWIAFVDNLSRRVSRRALREYFSHHGRVVKVFIPLVNKRPRSKESTFAFVHFACQDDLANAFKMGNNSLIDRKKISVGVARFPKKKNSGVETCMKKVDERLDKHTETQNKIIEDRKELFDRFNDGMSYKEALINKGNYCSGENPINVFIPAKEKEWIKFSLTGILKSDFEIDLVQKALLNDGIEAKIVSWGYAWNACIIIFSSERNMLEAWQKKREELCYWFLWIDRLVMEIGIPTAFCSIELIGVPLNCWYESFFSTLANRWGKLVCIQEQTLKKQDLSAARLILRIASPFDIPEFVTILSDGRPFKVGIKIGSVLAKSEIMFHSSKSENELKEKEVSKKLGGDRSISSDEGDEQSREFSRDKVASWLAEGASGGSPMDESNEQSWFIDIPIGTFNAKETESLGIGRFSAGIIRVLD